LGLREPHLRVQPQGLTALLLKHQGLTVPYPARKKPGEVSRGEKMLYSGTDPESYISEYTLAYEENYKNARLLS